MSLKARFAVLSLAALAQPGFAREQASPARPEDLYRFRVNVDLVGLSVTVLDENRKLVTDLERENFSVFEDGVRQEIQIFSKEDLPLRMAILLDTSSSMQMKLPLAQEAAVRFVRSLKSGDQVEVIEFNDRVLTRLPFSSDFEAAAQAIKATEPEGATALYNALYVSLKDLSRRRKGLERQAIVVLSDGADTRSVVSFEDVRALARKTDVLIYSISLRASREDLQKQKYAEAKYVLGKLADETGGSALSPDKIEDLAGVYERIATELKSQYNIGYQSTNSQADGTWRRLLVHCTRPGTEVRTRLGYYAPRLARASESPKSEPPNRP